MTKETARSFVGRERNELWFNIRNILSKLRLEKGEGDSMDCNSCATELETICSLYAQQQTEELRKEYDMFKKNTAFREGLEIQARGRRDEEIEQLMDKNEKMLELIRKCEKFINLLLIPIRDRDQLLADIEKLNPKP